MCCGPLFVALADIMGGWGDQDNEMEDGGNNKKRAWTPRVDTMDTGLGIEWRSHHPDKVKQSVS